MSGVPQGSILGPLLFNLYINDLPLAVSEKCVLFADDAAFVITSSSLVDLFTRINKLFEDISRYLDQNCLVANAEKSKLMYFSSRLTNNLPVFIFSGRPIEWVSEFKYLGLVLTNKLSFGQHIARMALNVSRVTGVISSMRGSFPRYTLLKIYESLALPHVNLHLEVWGSAPAYLLDALEVKINNALRTVFGILRRNGIPEMGACEMYRHFGLLRLRSHFKLKIFKLLRSLIDGRLPDLYDILLLPYRVRHGYSTRNRTYSHPNLSCEVERRFLPYQLITLYEELPAHMTNESLARAVRMLKGDLLLQQ